MKTTRWMKPVADCGGITHMIQKEVKNRWHCAIQDLYRVNIAVHSYREVGTSLEANVEVQVHGPFGLFVKMGRIII